MQPWAAAVVWMGKDVENRSKWPFRYRGPLVIHASKTRPYLEDFAKLRKIAKQDGFPGDLIARCDPTKPNFPGELFQGGRIVGVATLEDVLGKDDDDVPDDHPARSSPWANLDAPYWLYFSAVTRVKPIPYKGAVGMFKVPYEIAAALEELPDE